MEGLLLNKGEVSTLGIIIFEGNDSKTNYIFSKTEIKFNKLFIYILL